VIAFWPKPFRCEGRWRSAKRYSDGIDRIHAENAVGHDAFREDLKLQVWVLYHLQVVGEACRGLSDSFRNRFSDPV